MSLARHAKARDANEPEVIAALEQLGAYVYRLDQPVDLLVGWRGEWFLIEVKLPLGPRGGGSHSPLSDDQMTFMRDCRYRGLAALVVRSGADAVASLTELWTQRQLRRRDSA